MTRPPIFESYSSEMPPPGDEALPMSKPAVFGFILSLLQCLPVLAGIGAVVLGILGLLQIRRKQAIGRPLAIAAIAIGALSIVVWAAVGGSTALVGVRFASVEETGRWFIQALAEGDMDRARDLASDDVTDEQLEAWGAQLAAQESRPDVMMWNFSLEEEDKFSVGKLLNGPYRVDGQVTYRSLTRNERPDTRRTSVVIAKEPAGLRVRDLAVRPADIVLPDPEQLLKELKGLDELKKLEEFRKLNPGRPLPPPTRPSTRTSVGD